MTTPNPTNENPALAPIVDGFTLVPSLIPLSYQWDPSAIQGWNLLRRANLLTPMEFSLPENEIPFIAPYDTYERRIDLPPGSYLQAIRYIELDTATGLTEVEPNGGQIRLTEGCTGVQLTSDFVGGAAYAIRPYSTVEYSPGTPYTRGRLPFLPLSQPRPIADPGSMLVEIANRKTDGTNLVCRLILLFAIPCIRIDQFPQFPQGGK